MIDIKRIVESKDEVEKALSKRMSVEDMHLDEIIDLYNKRYNRSGVLFRGMSGVGPFGIFKTPTT